MHPGLYALIAALVFAIAHGFHFPVLPLTDTGNAVHMTRFAPRPAVSPHTPGNRNTAVRPEFVDLRYAGID
tara:strand:+ start:4703 stop:4915 length:213 start_codon:yes stop_codon:yes gene_type:complete